MNIVVTGANGFIGKNLIFELKNRGYENIYPITKESPSYELYRVLDNADFVFHLAGVNRPLVNEEFEIGNVGLTEKIINYLLYIKKSVPIVYTSSIQAESSNLYGQSKRKAELILENYKETLQADIFIYRLPNVFGKWSKPNYNSVIATFCYNISRDLDIKIDNQDTVLQLIYIDDIIKLFVNHIENPEKEEIIIEPIYKINLNDLAKLIFSFKEGRENLDVINTRNSFEKKLYSTYLSFLPEDKFSYELKMNVDERGSFTEFLRMREHGQISINISKPGITKGNHWHHTKIEKFLVVSGEGIIRLRKIDSEKIIEYPVNGKQMTVVDIPVGYTHSIVNTGKTDLVTIIWVNELFDQKVPDTFFMEV